MSNEVNTVCTICGHKCKPRGIGAHMRLKHGIKVTTVVRNISDLSGKVQRPSDWRNKKTEVVETRMEAAPAPSPIRKVDSKEVQDIIVEINRMTREAEALAVKAGTFKERYMKYVRDPKRMNQLLRKMNELLA